MKMSEILDKELKDIKLSKRDVEEFMGLAREFISSLEAKGLKAIVGGSFAKGTAICKSKKQDVDIFVVFEKKEDLEKLRSILGKMELGKKLSVVHGSRDYFQVDVGGAVLEIVPVMKNGDPSKAENVTDVSLSHVKYVVGEINKNKKLADEILLAKSFCKAQRSYGAESYIHGFSGYSLEVLVIYFGGFLEFLKGIRKTQVIDPKKYFKGKQEILRELNQSKMGGPIILIDPTYKYRNVCAGLGEETFERFLKVSGEFLKKPSLEFFELRDIDVGGMKKRTKEKKALFVGLEINTDRPGGDVAGAKMRKFFDFFVDELNRKKQEVLEKEFDYSGEGSNAKGYLVVKEFKEIEVRGPSVKMKGASEKFKKARGKSAYKKKGYWWFKERTSIREIFESCKRVESEMGVGVRIKIS